MNNINFQEELSEFVFKSKYARYREEDKRRETWDEMVDRVEAMHLKKFKKLPKDDLAKIRWAFDMVRQKRAVPSMRSCQFGGKAIEANHLRGYNCGVRHIDSLRAFAEIFYALLCGCGVGFGLSPKFLGRLPDLVNANHKTGTLIPYVVEDTIEGWADSLEALLNCYFQNNPYTGRKIVFDYSRIRPKGSPLKTTGGKAPGYKGLKFAHQKIKELLDRVIEENGDTRLRSIVAYDIVMHAADSVLSGGVRRSATNAIFPKEDKEMMNAKTNFDVSRIYHFSLNENTKKHEGKVVVGSRTFEVELSDWEFKELKKNNKISWTHIEPQRARSNNSVILLRNEVSQEEFEEIIKLTRQWGEPGFVFADDLDMLFNPCFEIAFLPVTKDGVCGFQMCNLTSNNGAKVKTIEQFFESVEASTVIGTLQAAYTDFKYFGHVSKQLTEEEALLGVSITGIMDNPQILLDPVVQGTAANLAVTINKRWADKIGIKQAARITCLKPEGTGSTALGAASGIHAWHSRRFFRRIQNNKIDNVHKHFKKYNPHAVEESVWCATKTDDSITFPIEVPETAMLKSDLTALKHLAFIKSTQENWVMNGATQANHKHLQHNVSCTVDVKPEEWEGVIKYVYDNRNYFCAVSFLPSCSDKAYKQPPFEAVTTAEDEERWKKLTENFKHVPYDELIEGEDKTNVAQEIACSGNKCELV